MILSFGTATPVLAVPSAVALVAYLAAALLAAQAGVWLRVAFIIGWVAQGLAILVDVAGVGSGLPGARFGFAPALSATLWLVLAVHAVESRFVPLHWVLGIVSYGLFGAAVLHAAMLSRAERQMRLKRTAPFASGAPTPLGLPLLRLEKLTFRFVEAGFCVLSATLLLGWWFADPWRWDHKAVFSILGWVVFAGLLAGRQAFGWRGRQATGWLYAGAVLLMLAYVGSRFVMEVVLHRLPTG